MEGDASGGGGAAERGVVVVATEEFQGLVVEGFSEVQTLLLWHVARVAETIRVAVAHLLAPVPSGSIFAVMNSSITVAIAMDEELASGRVFEVTNLSTDVLRLDDIDLGSWEGRDHGEEEHADEGEEEDDFGVHREYEL